MTKTSDSHFDPIHESGFRRGFTHGVQRVISAVEPHLTDAQLSKLRRWAQDEVSQWAISKEDPIAERPF